LPRESKKFEEESKVQEKKWRIEFNRPPFSEAEKEEKFADKKNTEVVEREVKFSYD